VKGDIGDDETLSLSQLSSSRIVSVLIYLPISTKLVVSHFCYLPVLILSFAPFLPVSSSTLSDTPSTMFGRDTDVTSFTTDMSDLTLGGLDHFNRLATPSPPPRISPVEAKHYYHGLPSKPRLIARTGAPWYPPWGPEAYLRVKELRIPRKHELLDLWEDNLALKVHDILDQNEVNWSSTDIVRIAYVDDPDGNLILWIGVRPRPNPLSFDVGIDVALQCKRLLLDHRLADVDVELRESDIIETIGPPLLEPTDITDPTAIQREPFTATLGITICAQDRPWAEGTAGFFLAVIDVNKLFLVTARHVLFPRSDDKHFEHTHETQARHNVLLLSESSFQQHLLSMKTVIDDQDYIIADQERRIGGIAGKEDAMSRMIREDAELEIKKAKRRAEGLTDFHRKLSAHWATDKSRILGHVIYSPPIVIGANTDQQQYTQDIAVIEIDTKKIKPNDFPGNFIDLGTKYTPSELRRKMQPPAPENPSNFTFPGNRLLRIWGTIPREEMREPKMFDQNGEACITVLKRGRSTNLTLGRATTFVSYTRKYISENDAAVSKEWVVIPLDKESGGFSAKGDSGSVVVDSLGRIVGMATSGSGATETSDVTFVTPIDFIMEIIHKHEPLANAYIMLAPSD